MVNRRATRVAVALGSVVAIVTVAMAPGVSGAVSRSGETSSPASARALPGSSTGMFAQMTYLSVPINNINGIFTYMHIANMKRPGNSACPNSFTRISTSCSGTSGGNARSEQVEATFPATAQAAGEFTGYGYATACINGFTPATCSTTPSVGSSWPEFVYYDGVRDTGSSYVYYGAWRNSYSVNSSHSFKLEKQAGVANWSKYIDGVAEAHTPMTMWYGYGVFLMERSGAIAINLDQHYMFGMQRRQFGGSYSQYEQYLLYDAASGPQCQIFLELNNPLIGDNISSTGASC